MRKILSIITILALVACKSTQTAPTVEKNAYPDYSKPLLAGQRALVRIPSSQWPDLGKAWEERDLFLRDSLDNSISWFDAPSSKQWFPMEGITHEQAKNSVIAIRDLLASSKTKNEFLLSFYMIPKH